MQERRCPSQDTFPSNGGGAHRIGGSQGFDPDSLPIRELADQCQQAAWSCKKKTMRR
jgi:hypothetical protein